MITSIHDCARESRHLMRNLALSPRTHLLLGFGKWFLAGFCLSAASLSSVPQPLALGLLCACGGLPALLTGLGGILGYWLFWGKAGTQGIFWMAAGLPCALLLGEKRIARDTPLLLPSIATLIVSAGGVIWQTAFQDTTAIPVYLLRVLLAGATARLFRLSAERKDPMLLWLSAALGVLALAQILPLPYLGLGFIAAGILGGWGAFPLSILSGLALDLAGVCPVPMSAVLCLCYLARLIPWRSPMPLMAAPGCAYLLVSMLLGVVDLHPLPGLVIGGVLGKFLPLEAKGEYRRGETGVAQVKLELAAGVMAQMEQLLIETPSQPIDEEALVLKAAERACGGCPCRKGCKEREKMAMLPANLLHRPLMDNGDLSLPFCRKSGRLLSELRRGQEQLRTLRGSRERLLEYRSALIQQYQFLSRYLQDLSDQLPQRAGPVLPRFQAEVAICGNRPEADNGDRVLKFSGTGCRYYVLLCDGMGTGLGAVDEGKNAATLLRRLLTAGFPASHALRTLNSVCALRGKAGAVTADLAEISLDTGKTTLYKWGAAPSYLLTPNGAEKIGTAGPPPGLSVADGRETVERLSLRRGETLLLLSDGVGGEDALRGWVYAPDEAPGEMAARILENGEAEKMDDATVAAIRLSDAFLST